MAAATASYPPEPYRDGYSTIGNAPPAPAADEAVAAPATETSSGPATPAQHMQAVARGAGAAAVGAKEAVSELIAAPMPDVNVYMEPLNPAAQLTLKDRLQLVLESCRPWKEFVDPKGFGQPAASELKLRIGHNVEIFFYNYLVVGAGLLALFAVFHPIRALLLAITIVAGMLLYILFPEDYVITENFSITTRMKHVFMAVLALLVLTVGHVFALLLWVALTVVPLCLLHASFREHSTAVQSSI